MPINLHAHVLCRGVYGFLGISSPFLGPALFATVLLYCVTVMLVLAPILQWGLNKTANIILEDHDLPARMGCMHERAVGSFHTAKLSSDNKALSNGALWIGKQKP